MLFYLLAIASTGSGLFIVAVGAAILVYQHQRKKLAIHLIVSMVAAAVYFLGFSGQQASRIDYLAEHPMQAASFFLRLLGGTAELPYLEASRDYHPLLFGFLLLVYFIFHLFMTMRAEPGTERDPYIRQCALFMYLLIMLLLIVAGRTEQYRDTVVYAALDGRYRIYGMIFTAIAVIGFMQALQLPTQLTRKVQAAILSLALIFNSASFASRVDSMHDTAFYRVEKMQEYIQGRNPSKLETLNFDRSHAVAIIDQALSTDVYNP